MRNTGMAIAWYFWARHWIEFTILSVICLTAALIFGLAAPGTFGPRAAAATSIFLLPTLATLMVAFSHGLDAKIDGRMTGYPLHWFNLPLPTTALVGWPMFLGALVVAGVWILWVLCILRRAEYPRRSLDQSRRTWLYSPGCRLSRGSRSRFHTPGL